MCENCGSFIPVAEAAVDGVLSRVSIALLGRPLSSLALPEVATVLAWIPLLIGPPVAALVIVMVKFVQDRTRLADREWRRPAVIAAINIALSLLIWSYAVDEVSEVAHAAAARIWALFQSVPPPATIKAIPI